MNVFAYTPLTPNYPVAYTCLHQEKAYCSSKIKIQTYDNIKSNGEKAEDRRPLLSVHPNRTQPQARLHQD